MKSQGWWQRISWKQRFLTHLHLFLTQAESEILNGDVCDKERKRINSGHQPQHNNFFSLLYQHHCVNVIPSKGPVYSFLFFIPNIFVQNLRFRESEDEVEDVLKRRFQLVSRHHSRLFIFQWLTKRVKSCIHPLTSFVQRWFKSLNGNDIFRRGGLESSLVCV